MTVMAFPELALQMIRSLEDSLFQSQDKRLSEFHVQYSRVHQLTHMIMHYDFTRRNDREADLEVTRDDVMSVIEALKALQKAASVRKTRSLYCERIADTIAELQKRYGIETEPDSLPSDLPRPIAPHNPEDQIVIASHAID